jgi:hypothetical protein
MKRSLSHSINGMDKLKFRIECATITAEYNMLLTKDTPLQDCKNLAYSLIPPNKVTIHGNF